MAEGQGYWTGREWITPGGQETLPLTSPMQNVPGPTQQAQVTSNPNPEPSPTPQTVQSPQISPQGDQNQFMQQFLGSLMGIGRFGGFGGMGGMGGYGGGYGGMGGYGGYPMGGYGGYPMGGYGGYGGGYGGMGGYGGYPMGGMYRPQGPQPRGGIGRLARPSGPLPSGPTMMKEAGAATYGVPPSYDTTPSGGMTRGGFFFRRGGRV